MPLSRLRLRLAGWFALAFVAGLLVLSLTMFLYLRHQSETRFHRQLAISAGQLLDAVRLEYVEAPALGVPIAVKAALDEWPAHPEAFGVYDTAGLRLGVVGPAALTRTLPDTLQPDLPTTPTDLPARGEHGVRLAASRSADPALYVVAAGTTDVLHEDEEAFAVWLLGSVPLTIILSLIGGYTLSRRALRPVGALEQAIAGITPNALDRRLPVNPWPDELDRLASRFNALLERLERSQAQNRRFLEEAAHQIRTPLTLVLGETDLALDRPRSTEAQAEALRRIRLAAGQMRRRVEELLLLARAEAGERPPLTEAVELDGLALECADLMRSRAQALGCRLELTRIDPAVVLGSEPLLREALVELLENACRHGSATEPVCLSVLSADDEAAIEVTNPAPQPESPPRRDAGSNSGLGLQVVDWIASEHGGRLAQDRAAGRVITTLHLPLSLRSRSSANRASGEVASSESAADLRGLEG
jgi:signal transduction histidine kinase